LNRVKPILVSLASLVAASVLVANQDAIFAQRGTVTGGPSQQKGAPVVDFHAGLPKKTTLKPFRSSLASRAGQLITPQTVDLTDSTPLVDDKNPYWSKDEQTIVFQSNRGDLGGTVAGTLSHIYTMRSDGSNVTAVTGPLASTAIGATASQSEPSFNPGGSSIVYIDGDASSGLDLKEYALSTGNSTSILKNNPQGFNFVGLNHPEYGFAVGGNIGVIFSGKRDIDSSYHLFTVDTQKGIVTQLTTGAFDDKNPTMSPDSAKPVVAFDRGPAGGGPRDIYVIGTNPNSLNVVKVTNFNVSGSDNIEPAWSTNKPDQPQANGNTIINGQLMIAFATTRMDSANNGLANAVNPNGSHDIYYLKVSIAPDVNNQGQYTVTTPETANNPALKLTTSDNSHIYDDRHPTWPQFINTYRVMYQSDRTKYDAIADANGLNASGPSGQPNDIFASTLIDINAPTLVRWDTVSGDILNVTPRISSPGSTVQISAKLADFETGIRDVWVQIKNPNSKYQSSDGKEHKVYLSFGSIVDGANIFFPANYEYEMQRIFIGNGTTGTPGTFADPKYIASVDDFFAFSGSAAPPDNGWLQLQFVSRDAATGVATYSAPYTTSNFPSDWVIDVIAYDNAINPFAANQKSNWKIYDNVWGFTTQAFTASHNILFVNDNGAGQKFFGSRFGNLGLNNVYYSFWGSESWMTEVDPALFPTRYIPKGGGTANGVINVLNALGVRSYGSLTEYGGTYDSLVDDGSVASDGNSIPATQQYDQWRILCRGPLPDAVLAQYGTHSEAQPPDTLNGEKTSRSVIVAPRCVFWHAPYTGSVFTGSGSLTDPSVQNQLHNFLQAGGRLFVNGQDIAWALTLDGAAQNSFLSSDLRANYASDNAGGGFNIAKSTGGIPLSFMFNGNYALQTSGQYDPITHDPWRNPAKVITIGPGHHYAGPPFGDGVSDYISNEQNYLVAGNDSNNPREYGSPGVAYPDSVTPIGTAISDMRFANGQTALMHYQDTTTNARLVYCSMGIEGLAPDVFTVPNTSILAFKNRRAEIFHNIACWMRTGVLYGTVRTVEGGLPLPNVLVRVYNKVDAKGAPIVAYTALTRNDGTFNINGVESDEYFVTAFKPGYSIQKISGQQVHGGFRSDISFRMTTAEPAVISGAVTRTDGTTPVVGATVTAKDNNDSTAPVLTTTTDINGNYSLTRVPSQTTYTLTSSATGYGTSIPVNYTVPYATDPITSQQDTTIQPAKSYKGFNFQLKAQPGSAKGVVYSVDASNNKTGVVAGATVTATLGTTKITAVTDASGNYSFDPSNSPSNGIDPGSASFVAVAPGYGASTAVSAVIISANTTTVPDILLSPVAPGSISGTVTRTSDNGALAGVLIQLQDANGNVVTSTTTSSLQSDGTNYRISSVPAGVTYTVVATKSGYTASPLSQAAAITSGVETAKINFAMDPLHKFAQQVSLVSTPYDYAGNPASVAQLLGVSESDPAFNFASYDIGNFVYFPQVPADKFRLGRAYFMGYSTPLPLSIQGTPADTTRPYDILLNAGWNLIGDPFLFTIDWNKVKVVQNGAVYSHSDALANGLIGSSLYSYTSGFYAQSFSIDPWVGYWVKAYQNVSLRIDPTTDGRGVTRATATSRAVLQGSNGWAANIQLDVNGLKDTDNFFGVSGSAKDTFDQYKSEKPPVYGKNYARLAFTHNDWGRSSGNYGIDVRSNSNTMKSWTFTAQSTVKNGTAVITWPNTASVDRKVNLTVTDLATGTSVDMRNSSSYTYNTGANASDRQFRIDAVPADGTALRVSNVSARQGTGRGAGVSISYALSTTANVDIRILDSTGGAVRRVNAHTTRSAGVNQATWDMKSDSQISVPSGVYSVEIKAQTPDGRYSARQISTIVVVR